jgi:hypothetical protein
VDRDRKGILHNYKFPEKDDLVYTFGAPGDKSVTGDWNNNGRTEIGVVRSNNNWLLDASGNGAYGTGDLAYMFGQAGDTYVTGKWR